MLLAPGNKILISHRRLFDKDEPRYFVGEVVAYDTHLVKVTGYSFVRDLGSGRVIRKEDRRTKLVSLTSGTFLVYQLPDEVRLENTTFESCEGDLTLTDGSELQMNMAELPHCGHI